MNSDTQPAMAYLTTEFLDVLRELGGAAGTADVADEVNYPQRTVYHRLLNLHDENQIDSRQIGSAMLGMVKNGG